jgi:hypothetical protein
MNIAGLIACYARIWIQHPYVS